MAVVLDADFTHMTSLPPELTWKIGGSPKAYDLNQGLLVEPKLDTDFWMNTYYDPVLQNYNGHVLGIDTTETMLYVETKFNIDPRLKFDQCGVFMGTGETTWAKAGVEFVDGSIWQSVVATRDAYSDWSRSTKPWGSTEMYLRMYRQNDSGIVEVSEDGVSYDFVRIFHVPMNDPVTMGIMICRPEKQDSSSNAANRLVNFSYMKIAMHDGYEHHA